ncbi:hypothetical protein PSP30_gp3c [Pseudomonas phage PSP30]|nr:hypothetical protein PSP30_gp3c [Pseudomonas phage PSP30]
MVQGQNLRSFGVCVIPSAFGFLPCSVQRTVEGTLSPGGRHLMGAHVRGLGLPCQPFDGG